MVAFKPPHLSDILMSLPVLAIHDSALVRRRKSCLRSQSQGAISSTYHRGLRDQEPLKAPRLCSLTSV